MIFIYALLDPETQQIRYVGKTMNLALRLRSHKNDSGETRKARWIRALRRRGLEPMLIVLDCVMDDDWQGAERAWITRVRELGANLTNLTDGGEGLHNACPETRAKLAAIRVACWEDTATRERLLARLRDPVRRAKILAALSGKPKAPEHVAKLPQNQPGYRRLLSDTLRQRLAEGARGNQHRKGVPHTGETRAKISDALKGNQHTRGWQMPAEERERRSLTLKGRPKSTEWREKIKQGQLRSWARRKANLEESHGELSALDRVAREAHTAELTDSGDDPQ